MILKSRNSQNSNLLRKSRKNNYFSSRAKFEVNTNNDTLVAAKQNMANERNIDYIDIRFYTDVAILPFILTPFVLDPTLKIEMGFPFK